MYHNNFNTQVEIQVQTSSGFWQTTRTVPYGNAQYIIRQMELVKHVHPKNRVRAVSSDGHLIDMLP